MSTNETQVAGIAADVIFNLGPFEAQTARARTHLALRGVFQLGTNREISRYTPIKFNIAIEQLASQKGK